MVGRKRPFLARSRVPLLDNVRRRSVIEKRRVEIPRPSCRKRGRKEKKKRERNPPNDKTARTSAFVIRGDQPSQQSPRARSEHARTIENVCKTHKQLYIFISSIKTRVREVRRVVELFPLKSLQITSSSLLGRWGYSTAVLRTKTKEEKKRTKKEKKEQLCENRKTPDRAEILRAQSALCVRPRSGEAIRGTFV